MALIECYECGREVSSEAEACPHCGAKPRKLEIPINKPINPMKIFVGVVVGFFVLLFLISNISPNKEPSNSEQVSDSIAKENKDAECLLDLKCAGDKFTAESNAYCRGLLEDNAASIAKWDFKIGEGGFFDFLFDKFRWADSSHQQIIYIGNKAKFQNGFGAWQRVGYSCSFDVATKRPLAAWFDNQPMPPNAISKLQSKQPTSVNSPDTLALQSGNQGPSFKCSSAKSTAELLICNDEELSLLDRDLAALFEKTKEQALDKKKFLNETRSAWSWREKNCRDKECLLNWYSERNQLYTDILKNPQA